VKRDLVQDPVRFVDERANAAPLLRKTLRYLFPDHWSFLLGEVALYAFVVLVATGVFLALFFEPSLSETVYRGSYEPLRGATMSDAYRSAVDLSFDVKAGLLMRQTHHWAADVFVAAIVVHLMRVFFTGAFRRPRELTYVIGLLMLFTALL
jgi:ubiquinol-cytochrome c reductase cytochrome b subunit